jgi:hypothetical protein
MEEHRKRKSAFGTRDIHHMSIEKVVGSGMYGVVYKAIDKVLYIKTCKE